MIKRIQKHGDAIFCLLYGTPLVQYYADEKIVVRAHPRRSSNAFSSQILPPGLQVACNDGMSSIVVAKDDECRFYRFKDKEVTLIPQPAESEFGYMPDMATVRPWVIARIDKKAAMIALKKYNYMAFREYLITRVDLSSHIPEQESPVDKAECLLDRSKWKLLVNTTSLRMWSRPFVSRENVDRLLKELRKEIYEKEGCIVVTEYEYLTKWSQVRWSHTSPWN